MYTESKVFYYLLPRVPQLEVILVEVRGRIYTCGAGDIVNLDRLGTWGVPK